MKLYIVAALGATALTGTAMAFARRSAPSIIRRSTTLAMVSPAEFAKAEIASSDVSVPSDSAMVLCISQRVLEL